MVVPRNSAFCAHCHLCGALGPRMQTPHEAASAWNHRPFELVALKAQAESLEALGQANARAASERQRGDALHEAARTIAAWWRWSEAGMALDGEAMAADQVVLHYAGNGASIHITVADLRRLVDADIRYGMTEAERDAALRQVASDIRREFGFDEPGEQHAG